MRPRRPFKPVRRSGEPQFDKNASRPWFSLTRSISHDSLRRHRSPQTADRRACARRSRKHCRHLPLGERPRPGPAMPGRKSPHLRGPGRVGSHHELLGGGPGAGAVRRQSHGLQSAGHQGHRQSQGQNRQGGRQSPGAPVAAGLPSRSLAARSRDPRLTRVDHAPQPAGGPADGGHQPPAHHARPAAARLSLRHDGRPRAELDRFLSARRRHALAAGERLAAARERAGGNRRARHAAGAARLYRSAGEAADDLAGCEPGDRPVAAGGDRRHRPLSRRRRAGQLPGIGPPARGNQPTTVTTARSPSRGGAARGGC